MVKVRLTKVFDVCVRFHAYKGYIYATGVAMYISNSFLRSVTFLLSPLFLIFSWSKVGVFIGERRFVRNQNCKTIEEPI